MPKAKSSPSGKKSKAKQAPEVGILLDSCRVVGFSVVVPDENPEGKSVSFTTAIDYIGEPQNGVIGVGVKINGALEADGGEPETVISLLTLTLFTISNAPELRTSESGGLTIPGWIIATMVSVAIGTTRGILLERLGNTLYKGITFPILGLTDFMPKSPENDKLNHGI